MNQNLVPKRVLRRAAAIKKPRQRRWRGVLFGTLVGIGLGGLMTLMLPVNEAAGQAGTDAYWDNQADRFNPEPAHFVIEPVDKFVMGSGRSTSLQAALPFFDRGAVDSIAAAIVPAGTWALAVAGLDSTVHQAVNGWYVPTGKWPSAAVETDNTVHARPSRARTSGGALTRSELVTIVAQHFPPDAVQDAADLALCESRGRPWVINGDGENSVGIFQINLDYWSHWWSEAYLLKPEKNAKAAAAIYEHTGGWLPWHRCAHKLGLDHH